MLTRSVFATVVAACVALTVAAPIAGGTFAYPATRVGDLAKRYVESLNSGDAARIEAFTVQYRSAAALAKRPTPERVQRTIQMHAQMGALVPALITEGVDGTLSITMQAEKLGMWLSCKFVLENEEPYKLDSVIIAPTSPPDMQIGEPMQWETLRDLLETLVEESGIPAIAAAIVDDGRIVDRAVVGTRWVGSGTMVEADDRFHIGSVTKSITATMIGGLVEKGAMTWDLTVEEALGDINMKDAYRKVTVEQLLQHRAGLPAYANLTSEDEARLSSLGGTPTEQRGAFASEVLMSEPIGPPGASMSYSNAGYSLAAYMAERVTGRGWEALVQTLVLDPLEMRHAGEGWPATKANPDQPRGHFTEGGSFRPQRLDEYPLGAFLSPAGNFSASIDDMVRYAQMHLAGLSGEDGILTAATIARLHTPPQPDEDVGYALGWVVRKTETGTMHYHTGSAGTFYAVIELYPEKRRAIICMMNVGPDGAAIAQTISDRVNERLASRPN